MITFPRFVYRKNGSEYRLVKAESEFNESLDSGWYESAVCVGRVDRVVESVVPVLEPVKDENAPPTRAEMMIQAEKLGIKVDGRWRDQKLLAIIEKAMKE